MKPNKDKKIIAKVIEPREISEEMQEAYLDYAMSVIVSRALPDVRDGLKPVQRRILYAMWEDGLKPGTKFKKCASVIGSVLARYHPHGDMAVYGALARMAQDFSLRYPLIEGQGNFGCFTGETKIKLADGRDLSFRELIQEQKQGKRHWGFAFNPQTKKIEITEIQKARLTRKKEKLIEVTLDNGEKIKCTLDHRFMLRNGQYREAQKLKAGDSLMPLNIDLYKGKSDLNLKGYKIVYQPMETRWDFIHRLADEWNLKNRVYLINAGRVRHHKDFNKLNNNPDNILRIQWKDHWQLHKEIASRRHREDPEYVKKIAQGRKEFWARKGKRELYSRRRSEMNKIMWQDPKYRELWTKARKKLWESPEYREFMKKQSSQNLTRLWQRKDFRVLMSNLKSKELKARWKDAEYKRQMTERMKIISRKIWADPEHHKYISKLMKERFEDPAVRKHLSQKSKELWQDPHYRAKFPTDHFRRMSQKLWDNPKTRIFHRAKALQQWEDPEFRRKFIKGVVLAGKQRAKENPQLMKNLAVKAGLVLQKKWKDPAYKRQVLRSRILRYVHSLFSQYSEITPEVYEENRRNSNAPRIEKALNYFDNFSEVVEEAKNYNHNVVRTRILRKREDVYDITTEPWHNFALAAGVFVHNSIDGDPPAAYRYCLAGDALVITNQGLERIGEVAEKKDIPRKVLSFDGEIHSVSQWFDSGVHPTRSLRTFRGYSLKGTLNHPLLVLEKDKQGRPVFAWKQLAEVEKGQFAVIDRNNKALWPEREPSLKEFFPDIKSPNFKSYLLPRRMSPALAFIMGAITAEGFISASKKSSKWKIGFSNTDPEFIKEFKEKFKEVFPEVHIGQQKRGPSGYGKKDYTSLEIGSIQLSQFLQNLGLKAVRAKEKRVPSILFKATKKSITAFLRGFVEGDGSIFLPASRGPRIVFVSASQRLLQEIQLLLLRLGIVAFLREDRGRGTWILWTGGRNNLQLFKAIGFVSKKKQKKLEDYSQIDEEGHGISKTDFIPFLSDFLREKYRKKKIKGEFKEWLIKHNLDRYSKLKRYYPVLERFLDKKDLKLIKSLLRQNYLFDQIVSLRKTRPTRVYSPKVESQCHSFVANGFVNHNTESRLSPIGEIMLQDIEKKTVDFVPNYDKTRQEPAVLPAPLPQLLLNGSLGIAVGMATDIPPHNAREVGEALIYLLDHPQATTTDLLQFIKGPDFPTGGIIYDVENMASVYSKGRGSIIVRGKAEIVEEKGKPKIIISEVPYRVNKSNLVRHIADLITNKKLKGVRTVRDESDREGIRVVVEFSAMANPQRVLNQLYKYTELQTFFHLNMVALVNGIQPESLSLAKMLHYYLEHRQEVVLRRTKFDLDRFQARQHILDGLIIALADIDKVIATIKQSKDRADARKNLIKKFKFSILQAEAILEIKLHRLVRLERKTLEEELLQIKAKIKELKKILASSLEVKKLMKKEINEAVEKYGNPRRTKVVRHKIKEIQQEDLIPLEEAFIVLTAKGYIKRMQPEAYHSQQRGGKGILGIKVMEGDMVTHLIVASTRDRLLFFTNLGKVYELPVFEIDEASRTSQGRNIANYLALNPGEKVMALINEKADSQHPYLVMVTEKGLVKKTAKKEYAHIRQNGLRAITLKPGDTLKAVAETSGEDIMILVSEKGKAIVFKEKEIRSMGRTASGLKGFSLESDDKVISLGVASKGEEKKLFLLVLTQKGFAKKTSLKRYRLQKRGGKGILTAKLTNKTGVLIFAKLLKEDEELVIISEKGQIIREETTHLPKLGRQTSGVKAMRLKAGDRVAAAVCFSK